MNVRAHDPRFVGGVDRRPEGAGAFAPLTLVEAVADQTRAQARAKNVALMAFVAPEIPGRVKGDRERLEQVLADVVRFAVRLIDRGEVMVHATLEQRSATGVILRFGVECAGAGACDTVPPGHGWGAAVTALAASGGGPYGGGGLGLAIDERLVNLMGGSMGVETRTGPGATFWFTVPLELPGGGPGPVASRDDVEGLHILVVDDNHSHRQILHRYLRHCGVKSDSAAGGADALVSLRHAAAAGEPYQLAIVDLSMPGMNGLELAEAIRREPALAPTRLVLLTAFDELGQDTTAREVGFSAYLTKPVQYARLLDTIRDVAGG